MFQMITPCDVEFNRCFDIAKNELQMSIKFAKLYIHLTPPNMRLLMDVVDILKQSSDQVRAHERFKLTISVLNGNIFNE